jgi:hypothetical protein
VQRQPTSGISPCSEKNAKRRLIVRRRLRFLAVD